MMKKTLQMVFLPYESCEITSSIDPEELMARLRTEIETDLPLFQSGYPVFYRGGKSFKGTIGQQSFVISRLSRNRYTLAPKIEGMVSPFKSGSKVRMVFSDKSALYAFIIVILLSYWRRFGDLTWQAILGFLAIIYILLIIFFNVEVTRAKKIMKMIIH